MCVCGCVCVCVHGAVAVHVDTGNLHMYICFHILFIVGPAEESSHYKLMDENPPLQEGSWLSSCFYRSLWDLVGWHGRDER